MEDNQSLAAQNPIIHIYSTAMETPSTYSMTESDKGVQKFDPPASFADESHPLTHISNPADDNSYAQSASYSAAHVANGCVTGDSNADDIASIPANDHLNHEEDGSVPAHIINYSSVNGVPNDIVDYHPSGVVEYGGTSDVSDPHAEAQQFVEVYSPEEERLWDAVRVNFLDFNAWTSLIEETEKVAEANILKIRKVYDAFLAEFPLCFGYWKKYADHEARLHSANKVLEVYERAILAVTYSVDIWLHYCVFAISIYEDPDIIRRLFERGLAYVGTDYLSYPLWDEYIRYEESQQAWSNLALIYTRILENPIQQLDRYYNCFKDLVASRALSEIRTPEEAALVAASVGIDIQGVHGEVVKLYERCLIACANYPEYWIRYVLCMEASGSMELAINALARATQVFVKKQPEIHLFAARFKERSGDILGARSQYELLYSEVSPGLLEALQKHVNMEYRLGNKEDALSLFEKAIAAEQEKEHSQTLPMLFILYSRFLYLVTGNAEKAREVFSGVLENAQLSKPLIEASIHLESILPLPKRLEYIDLLVESFITPTAENCYNASTTDREDISCTLLEFLDLFGDSQSIKKAEDRHALLFLRQKSMSSSKKRRADDFLASDKAKLSKSATLQGQSVMGAYPNSQNQWQAGYGLKAPSWPQGNPQAQGQTWNPGYPSQAGYGAYNYASYAQPQIPVSVPQGTPHGTFSTGYPTQAYTQQVYTQPAISSAAGFPQQTAAAVQPYYGATYY